MHDGTSEMMMKFTALGVVHDETEQAAKESGEASLSQTKRRRNEEIRTTHFENQGSEENHPSTVDIRPFLLMRLKVLMLNQNLR